MTDREQTPAEAATEVTVEVRVEAPPEVVFDYVTDPGRFPGVEGPVTLGEVVEREAPRRVRWVGAAGEGAEREGAVVEVTLHPDAGGTTVRVVQRPLGGPARARIALRHAPGGRASACRAAARSHLLARPALALGVR